MVVYRDTGLNGWQLKTSLFYQNLTASIEKIKTVWWTIFSYRNFNDDNTNGKYDNKPVITLITPRNIDNKYPYVQCNIVWDIIWDVLDSDTLIRKEHFMFVY